MNRFKRKWSSVVPLMLGLFLLAACQNELPLEEQIVGIWVDTVSLDTVMIEFLDNGTISAPDRPLLTGATYQFSDETHMQITFPATGDNAPVVLSMIVTILNDEMTLTNEATSQADRYSRVSRRDDLAEFLVAKWEGKDDAGIKIEFFADGMISSSGIIGLSDGSYILVGDEQIEIEFIEGRLVQFDVITTGEMLILRNELDQSLFFVKE